MDGSGAEGASPRAGRAPLALWAFGVVASTECSGAHLRAPLSRRVRRCGRSGPRASHRARPQRREFRSRGASSADVLRSAAGSHKTRRGEFSQTVGPMPTPPYFSILYQMCCKYISHFRDFHQMRPYHPGSPLPIRTAQLSRIESG